MRPVLYRIALVWGIPGLAIAAAPAPASDPSSRTLGAPVAPPSTVPVPAPPPAAPGTPVNPALNRASADDLAAPAPVEQRTSMKNYHETGFRYRHLWIPRGIMDTWYFDADAADWPYIEGRPGVVANAYGLEYCYRSRGTNGIFYVEFIDAAVNAGYWDDVEEPPDHLDGDWLVPTAGLGMVAFGADYAYEAHAVRIEDTGGAFGWSWLFGGGLGLGVRTGAMSTWGPDQTNGNPGYKRYHDGEPSDGVKKLPGAIPMVDVNVSSRFNFGNRATLRLEGGLHTFVFVGSSLSVML